MIEKTKFCNKCNKSVSLKNFGNHHICKTCYNEQGRKKYREKNSHRYVPSRLDLPNGNRICSRCKEEKTLESFLKRKNGSRGYARVCKLCDKVRRKELHSEDFIKDRRKKYYQKNKKKIREKRKARYDKNKKKRLQEAKEFYQKHKEYIKNRCKRWREDNPEKVAEYAQRRRALKLSNGENDLTGRQIKWLFEQISYCVLCKTSENLTLEHIVALSKGGDHTLKNCTVLCHSCNSSVNSRDLREFTNEVWPKGYDYRDCPDFI